VVVQCRGGVRGSPLSFYELYIITGYFMAISSRCLMCCFFFFIIGCFVCCCCWVWVKLRGCLDVFFFQTAATVTLQGIRFRVAAVNLGFFFSFFSIFLRASCVLLEIRLPRGNNWIEKKKRNVFTDADCIFFIGLMCVETQVQAEPCR
jgi:hypothetical protein